MRRTDRLQRRWTGALVLVLGFWLAGCPSVAASPMTVVVEQVAGRTWRADPRGLAIEIRQETDGRLTIALLGAGGEPVAPPPADAITLSAPDGVRAHFEPIGLNWRSRHIAGAPADGDRLSIVEADHRYDFQLNVHPADRPVASWSLSAMTAFSRRSALAVLALGATGAGFAFPAAAASAQVFRSPSCTCCGAWIDHMARAEYRLESVVSDDLVAVRRSLGVPDALAACHTAVISGFAIEGHVPASDVTSLLARRPTGAVVLAVPGMPLGSPEMETRNGTREAYATLLILPEGRTRTFAQH